MPFERILAAIDGSEYSDRAFATALELAELTAARPTALAIEGPLPAYAATIGEVEEEIRPGHAAEVVSQVAAEGHYDLVVLGHGGHFVRDHLLGSTADRVAENAPWPVRIVR
jgi:nucleotide-binding universal stress UspA family protein